MSNSPLVNYTQLSPNHYNGRGGYKITKITPHHMAGALTVETCGNVFSSPARQASSNYGIGSDGRIGLYVDEANAAWTSSSYSNDCQAVTIEVANSAVGEPWPISDAAWNSLVNLCVDICKRNGIKGLTWTGDSSGSLTCHYMFAPTGCPGTTLQRRMPELANAVNSRLNGTSTSNTTTTTKKVYDVKPIYNNGGDFYRYYNPKSGEHLIATKTEGNTLKSPWKSEGKAFTAPKGGTVAVYRLVNPITGLHILTASYDEAASLEKSGWTLENVPFFGVAKGTTGATAIYRLYNGVTGDHLLTKDKNEKDTLAKQGWKDEGVAFYV